ncbi:hypothetical protein AVEN_187383-1 [Araneus ventricosus]|uniref:PiggyBac transposable element-derived protein domain-containing protein n=1 Tax=Araneus ventricosus TaxID=182803 RepID=A0A4Y2Q1V9_ARAVE|nr:hypothetical protein AVEN_187383-1 [Araneus ventricosus]
MWMLCTSNFGYTLDFELYSGKRDKIVKSENGLGYDVVMRLSKSFQEKGHEIYFDRFFTSIPLMVDKFRCEKKKENIKEYALEKPSEKTIFRKTEILPFQPIPFPCNRSFALANSRDTEEKSPLYITPLFVPAVIVVFQGGGILLICERGSWTFLYFEFPTTQWT